MRSKEAPLSPETLRTMTEADLRTLVLIPLFRRMGFLGVQDHHGGSQEQGKDIVMWKRREFGRINTAVVVKAVKITGQVAKSGSAADVVFQIQQSFGGPYIDGTSGAPEVINECLVVCPHEIKKEGLTAIRNALNPDIARAVRFLHGEALWEEVRTKLGTRAAIHQLGEIGRVLENADPNYRIVATAKGAQVALSVEPRTPRGQPEPLTITALFSFPNDEDGLAAEAALLRNIETGEAATISGAYLTDLTFPPFMQEAFGTPDIETVALFPMPTAEVHRMLLSIETISGCAVALPELAFQCRRRGTKEATFIAEQAGYQVELTLKDQTRSASLRINTTITGVNVTEALDAIRLRRALSQGAKLILRDAKTKFTLMEETSPAGSIEDPGDDLEALLTDLVTIQQITRTPIVVPERELTSIDQRTARGLATGLSTGVVPLRIGEVSMKMVRRGAEQITSGHVDGAVRMAVVRDETVSIVDTDIKVGRVARIVENGIITAEDRTRIIARLSDPSVEEVDVRVDCSSASAKAVYLDRLSPEEVAQYAKFMEPTSSAPEQK